MNVQLTPEQEQAINAALQSGEYRSATEVLDEALQALKDKRRGVSVQDSERQEAIDRLRSFGQRHGLSLDADITVKS